MTADNEHHILVVDDEESIRILCKETLSLQGFSIDIAEDGQRAIDLLSCNSYSLVLSDIMMPFINGLELTEMVRNTYPDTFVILITGQGSVDVAKTAIKKGAFDFITKPFKIPELVQVVRRALKAREQQIINFPVVELKMLYEFTSKSTIEHDSMGVFIDRFANSLLECFAGDAVTVFLSDRVNDPNMNRVAGVGDKDLLDEGGWASLASKVYTSESGLLGGENTKVSLSRDSKASFLAATTIPCSDGILGVCLIVRSESPTPFTPRDLKLLNLFSAHAGNQIINYRLSNYLREHASNLEKVNLLTGEFSSSLDVESVLSSIGQGLSTMIPFDLFGVFLMKPGELPLCYLYIHSDLPEKTVCAHILKRLDDSFDADTLHTLVNNKVIETFSSERTIFIDKPAHTNVIDLGDYGQFSGTMMLASWSGKCADLETSTFLPIIVRHAAAALQNAHLYEASERTYIQTIAALASAVDAKDPYTNNHSRNVAAYTYALLNKLNFSATDRKIMVNAALLHDIGKIGIPEHILNKQGPLTDAEYAIIQEHPGMGYKILSPIIAFGAFIDGVRTHHERFDGRGYPLKLKGEDIPYLGRILAITDSFDAMTSDRVYRSKLPIEIAIGELENNAGKQFDPRLVEIFVDLLSNSSLSDLRNEYLDVFGEQTTL